MQTHGNYCTSARQISLLMETTEYAARVNWQYSTDGLRVDQLGQDINAIIGLWFQMAFRKELLSSVLQIPLHANAKPHR